MRRYLYTGRHRRPVINTASTPNSNSQFRAINSDKTRTSPTLDAAQRTAVQQAAALNTTPAAADERKADAH